MNTGNKLAALAAFASAGVTFVLYSVLARTSSKSSSITKGNNNNSASQSNLGLSILLDSAREYYVRGDYKKADIFFERVLEIEPNNIEILGKKKDDSSQKIEKPAPSQGPSQKIEKPAPSQGPSQKIEKPAPSQGPSQKIEKPVPSQDSGTIPRA